MWFWWPRHADSLRSPQHARTHPRTRRHIAGVADNALRKACRLYTTSKSSENNLTAFSREIDCIYSVFDMEFTDQNDLGGRGGGVEVMLYPSKYTHTHMWYGDINHTYIYSYVLEGKWKMRRHLNRLHPLRITVLLYFGGVL